MQALLDKLRMTPWLMAIVGVLVLIVLFGPPELGLGWKDMGVVTVKFCEISGALYLAYLADRTAFPYARPDKLVDLGDDGDWTQGEAIVFAAALMRRAILMVAVVIGFAIAI